MLRPLGHASAAAVRAEAALYAVEGDEAVVPTAGAAETGEAVSENAAAQLLLDEGRIGGVEIERP